MEDCKCTLSSWNLRIPWKNHNKPSWKNNQQSAWNNNDKSVWKNKGIPARKIPTLSRGRITKTPGGNVYFWSL
eukprot:14056088-Heterocapsa_arctica.AAC.1